MSVNPIPARKGRAFLFALTIFVLSVAATELYAADRNSLEPSQDSIIRIVTQIQRSDYEGDRPALKRLSVFYRVAFFASLPLLYRARGLRDSHDQQDFSKGPRKNDFIRYSHLRLPSKQVLSRPGLAAITYAKCKHNGAGVRVECRNHIATLTHASPHRRPPSSLGDSRV
jgi:hypothetical protein